MIDDKKSTDPFEAMDAEFKRLRDENARLRAMLGIPDSGVASQPEASTPDLRKSGGDLTTPAGKIALFRSLFRAREDVYAVRWEGKAGKSGYSPAAAMDWRATNAARPEERKCIARKTRIRCACSIPQFQISGDEVRVEMRRKTCLILSECSAANATDWSVSRWGSTTAAVPVVSSSIM